MLVYVDRSPFHQFQDKSTPYPNYLSIRISEILICLKTLRLIHRLSKKLNNDFNSKSSQLLKKNPKILFRISGGRAKNKEYGYKLSKDKKKAIAESLETLKKAHES